MRRTFSLTDAIDGRTLLVLTRVSSLPNARKAALVEANKRGDGVSLICQTDTDRVLIDNYFPDF